nr:hypothetical protein [Xanthomonas citri]
MAQIIEAKALTAQDAEFVGRRINEILFWHGLRSMDEQGWGDVCCQSADLLVSADVKLTHCAEVKVTTWDTMAAF